MSVTTYQERVYWNTRTYGKVIKIKARSIGIILDLIIPCTFGIITYLLNKHVKEVRIPWKD